MNPENEYAPDDLVNAAKFGATTEREAVIHFLQSLATNEDGLQRHDASFFLRGIARMISEGQHRTTSAKDK